MSNVEPGDVVVLSHSEICLATLNICYFQHVFLMVVGVVGWCEGAVYLRSLGRPTDIGLQLGKACYPCSG